MRRARVLRRGGLLLAGTALPLAWLLAAPADGAAPATGSSTSAQAAPTQTATVGDTVEAWYAASPVDICTTPLGCAPSAAPTSPYPADTLHVGLAGGQETARTYVVPDLSALPFDATPVSGTMTLPVATGTTDGTASAASAQLKACLATALPTDAAQGSTSKPPSVDCATSAPATYDGAKGVFTIDLLPFLSAWHAGTATDGIALLPKVASSSPSDAWHVAFNGRKRAGSPHISSTITVRPAPDTSGDLGSAPPPASIPAAPPAAPLPAPAAGAPLAPAPVVAPSAAAQAPAVQAQPVAFVRPFQYPLAFLLPLALLAGAVFFARLFTRDATPRRLGT